jgi:uncharacterized protein YaiI (UPF0178 family)
MWYTEYVVGVSNASLRVFRSLDGEILRIASGISNAEANLIADTMSADIILQEDIVYAELARLCESVANMVLADDVNCD